MVELRHKKGIPDYVAVRELPKTTTGSMLKNHRAGRFALFHTGIRLMAFCAAMLAGGMLQAAQVTLAWDAVSDFKLAGYRIYRKPVGGVYTLNKEVGIVTSTIVTGLNPGETYFFVATAFDSDGFESANSNEIQYDTPANLPPVATAGSLNATEDIAIPVTLQGTDAEGEPLTFAISTPPANGTLTGTPPNVSYKGNLNFNGTDSFAFTVGCVTPK